MFFQRGFVLLVCTLVGGLVAVRFAMGHLQKGAGTAAFWILVATTLSGFATTLCKCASLLATHATAMTYLSSPYFYVMVGAGIFLSIAMVYCINTGLREGDALVVVPMYYALGMLFQMLVAGVFFSEFD